MKLNRYALLLAILLAATVTTTAQRIVMKVMDPSQVPGEALMQGFTNWSEVLAVNAGASSGAVSWGGPGGSVAPPTTKCFTISMMQDKMVYYLKREMYTGSTLTSVEINALKETGQPSPQSYYRVLMENVYVTMVEEALNEDGMSVVNISFVPERFRYTYYPQTQTGALGTPVVFGWNQRTNQIW